MKEFKKRSKNKKICVSKLIFGVHNDYVFAFIIIMMARLFN